MMKRDEEGHIYCPQGHAFTLEQSKESTNKVQKNRDDR